LADQAVASNLYEQHNPLLPALTLISSCIMDNSASLKLLFFAVIFFAVLTGGIWVVLLRPVPLKTAMGTIMKRSFEPAGTYWQHRVGVNRGFRTATPIPIAEAYIFEVSVDGFENPFFYSLITVASQAFEVGTRVQVRYQEKSIPFIWKRLYVVDMRLE
jgi:hypothetical protein